MVKAKIKKMVFWQQLAVMIVPILIALVIGISGTIAYEGYRDLMREYNKSMEIINDHFEKEEIENKKEDGEAVKASLYVAPVVEAADIEFAASNPEKTVKKIASEEGIDWKVLWAIYQKESQGDCQRIGDGHLKNPSIGCYQINQGYHPQITMEQATDLEWSSRWTAQRLKKHESLGLDEMIRSHNGLVADHSNDWYVQDVKKIMASL